jgi:TATA-binding protein-associated factor Taf7
VLLLLKKKLSVKKELKKASKASGVSVHMVQALDSDANRKDLDAVPAFILKLFPQLNIDYVKDVLKQQDGVYADYEGNVHNTVEEADKANTILRHKMLEQKILTMVEEHTRLEFQSNRLAEIKTR